MKPSPQLQETRQEAFMSLMTFTKKFNAWLGESRYKQSDLAKLFDVHQTIVSRWAKGKARPTADQYLLLARLTNRPMEYWADDAVESPPVPVEGLQENERNLLWLARQMGLDVAIRRLTAMPESRPLPGRSLGEQMDDEAKRNDPANSPKRSNAKSKAGR